jgi:hypothetical protein
MSTVSSLCEDLVDDEKEISDVDDLVGDPLPPIKEKKVRQRRVYDSKNVILIVSTFAPVSIAVIAIFLFTCPLGLTQLMVGLAEFLQSKTGQTFHT